MKITGGMIGSAGWILADLVNMFRNEEQQAQYARNKQVVGKIASAGMKIAGAANPEFTKGKPDSKAKAETPTPKDSKAEMVEIPIHRSTPAAARLGIEQHNKWLRQNQLTPQATQPSTGNGQKPVQQPQPTTNRLAGSPEAAPPPQAKLAAGAFKSKTAPPPKLSGMPGPGYKLIPKDHPSGRGGLYAQNDWSGWLN